MLIIVVISSSRYFYLTLRNIHVVQPKQIHHDVVCAPAAETHFRFIVIPKGKEWQQHCHGVLFVHQIFPLAVVGLLTSGISYPRNLFLSGDTEE